MTAFSRAFAAAYPRELIIQLHGYDVSSRKSRSGAESGAILSATHASPSARLRTAAACMREHVDPATLLYGADVRELGGTTNTIARALQADGRDVFVHLEMGLPLRELLASDRDKRRALLECFGMPLR